jgi:branched-chain amino acid transport system substrate-binding protein
MLFVEWVNTVRGGVLVNSIKRPLSLTLIDDRTDKTNAKNITEYLWNNRGIKLFLGPYSSGLSRECAKVVQKHNGTMIATVSSANYVYKNRPSVFGVYMPGRLTWAQSLKTLSAAGAKTIAYVADNKFPNETCGVLWTLAPEENMTVIWHKIFPSQDDILGEMDSLREKLSQEKPDVLFACVNVACDALLNTIIDWKIDLNAFATTVCNLEKYKDKGRFIGLATPWMPRFKFTSEVAKSGSNNWTTQDFRDAFFRAWETEPMYHNALGWTAGIAMVEAIENANGGKGSTDPLLVTQALKEMDIMTIFGPVQFNEDGQNTKNTYKVIMYLPEHDHAVQVAPFDGTDWVYPAPKWVERKCFQYPGNNCVT